MFYQNHTTTNTLNNALCKTTGNALRPNEVDHHVPNMEVQPQPNSLFWPCNSQIYELSRGNHQFQERKWCELAITWCPGPLPVPCRSLASVKFFTLLLTHPNGNPLPKTTAICRQICPDMPCIWQMKDGYPVILWWSKSFAGKSAIYFHEFPGSHLSARCSTTSCSTTNV